VTGEETHVEIMRQNLVTLDLGPDAQRESSVDHRMMIDGDLRRKSARDLET
jgi:hypothetical protein